MGKQQILEKWVKELDRQGISIRDIAQFLDKSESIPKIKPAKSSGVIKIPVSIFKHRPLGALESLVKFLRENHSLRLIEIANKLDKNNVSLAGSYRNAKKKHSEVFDDLDYTFSIPVYIFSNKQFSVLENLCIYLKDHYKLSYHKIAVLLNRDDRTIWTVYNRANKRRKKV